MHARIARIPILLGTVLVALALVLAVPSEFASAAIEGDPDVALFDPGNGQWHLRYRDGFAVSFYYGVPGDTPLMGDWDCDGTDTVAMYRESTGFIYYRNTNDFGVADGEFFFGVPGDMPIAGDWDNDGCDTFGIYRDGKVFLRNSLDTGFADMEFFFGVPGDRPFAGDFTGDGTDTIGLYRESAGLVYFTHNLPTGTVATTDGEFFYGIPSDRIIADDWDLDGDDSVGIYRPSDGKFYLSNENVFGAADVIVAHGQGSWLPTGGDMIPQDPGDTVDCGDFGSAAESQAWHDYYFHWYGDIANLDADEDGVACETPEAPFEATYTLTFTADWDVTTHPVAFPPGPHFSGLVGGTHSDAATFWEVGRSASPGIGSMAETGSKALLTSEVQQAVAAGTAGGSISGGGISTSPGSVAVGFSVNQDNPLVTVVSMIAPSPDWFVGVSGLDLFQDGEWVEERTVSLWPYDSGTDSGSSYVSPDQDTNPPEPVRAITEAPLGNGVPLGQFVFTLTSPPS